MKSIKQFLNVPVLALVLLAVFVGYKVSGNNFTAMQPPVIAVVKIDTLFDGLSQWDDAEKNVAEQVGKNKAELERRNKEIVDLEAELKDIAELVKRRAKGDEIGLKKLELKSWVSNATAQAEAKKGALLQELYRVVCGAVNQIALANGYTLVLLDDSNSQIQFNTGSRIPPQTQVAQQVTARKVLYVDPMINITNQLITKMNNDFAAANAG